MKIKTVFDLARAVGIVTEVGEQRLTKTVLEWFETALTERETKIIIRFYGIGQTSLTANEIGKEYDVTKERINQIRAKGLRKLRKSLRLKKFVA